ncbi:MAG: hypothetical protein Q9191_006436 [Dirinaria sp. TL-2023a]
MDSESEAKAHTTLTTRSYGDRFLHTVFDEIAVTTPSRLYASIPVSTDLAEGFRDLTFGDVAHCVDVFANSVKEDIGCSDKGETIAYLGIPDLRNAVVFLAAVKCGYKLLLLSPRNQPSTNGSLLGQTQCNTLIYAKEMAPLFETLQHDSPALKGLQIQELETLQQQKRQPFEPDPKREDTMRSPKLILHSSGSTGTPKPITMTHGTFSTFDHCRKLPTVQGRRNNDFTLWDSTETRRFYSAFPPSHLAGVLSLIIIPIFSEASCPVLGPPLRPPSGELVREIMEKQRLKSLFMPPSVAEQIMQEPDGLDFFRGLDFMFTAGGPLSQSAGDLISSVTSVCQLYGSTETAQIPMLVPLPGDWAYMEFHPAVKLEMRSVDSEENICELVHYMDATTEKVTALNYNIPGATEYATRDLFIPHPTKPGLWRFHGRIDDILVLSNGEKFFPVPMETKLSGHPSLSGTLVVGQGRFQAALLLEPKVAVTDVASFIDEIWPFVEESNSLLPSQGRITRSRILVASSDRPFHRSPKGTVVRSLTLKAYEEDINALYANKIPDYSKISIPKLKATFKSSDIETWVRSIVLQAFPVMANASNSDDMFVLGLDSLKTMDILGMLKTVLKGFKDLSELRWLSSMTIYSNPTIEKLATTVARYLNSEDSALENSSDIVKKHRTALIRTLVDKYTKGINAGEPVSVKSPQTQYAVAVTGTTGSLGAQIVQQLSKSHLITTIICLDRGQDARKRHKQTNLHLDESKIQYFSISLGKPNLGLRKDDYIRLTSEVDVIIHNAWKVDFGQILESYEADHIRGVRTLIDWGLDSPKRPRIVFISSVSSVSNFSNIEPGMAVQEALVSNSGAPASMGYGESKFVAEVILGMAAEKAKIPVSILRVGQIAGSTLLEDPPWPVQEWFPSLVKSSKALALLPNDIPPIDWIPINKLATTIAELMLHDAKTSDFEVYNLINPHPVPWQSLKEFVMASCPPGTKEVPLKDWIGRLRALPENKAEANSKPALKILPFFEQMVRKETSGPFEVSRSERASATMASLEPVNQQWLGVWLKQWQF